MRKVLVFTLGVAALPVVGFVVVHFNPLYPYLPGGCSEQTIMEKTSPDGSEAGRPLHYAFRGLLSVYSRYGLHAHRVAYATFYTEGFSSFVASAAASIATGWNEPVPGRDFSPAEDQRLFTAHSDFRVSQALSPKSC
jgi:hypothetical protein